MKSGTQPRSGRTKTSVSLSSWTRIMPNLEWDRSARPAGLRAHQTACWLPQANIWNYDAASRIPLTEWRDHIRPALGPFQAKQLCIHHLLWYKEAAMCQVWLRRREENKIRVEVLEYRVPVSGFRRCRPWRVLDRAEDSHVPWGEADQRPASVSPSVPFRRQPR